MAALSLKKKPRSSWSFDVPFIYPFSTYRSVKRPEERSPLARVHGLPAMKRRGETPHKGLRRSKMQKLRRVEYTTFQKWQRNLDCELQIMSWLDCIFEREGWKEIVAKLRCKVFTEFQDRIRSRKNFSDKCIGLHSFGIEEISAEHYKLVGIGTDGASANIAACALKGLVEQHVPWVFWMWCTAHLLELAVKDVLKDTAFNVIDKFLLRLYSLYEKSPNM